MAERPQDDRFGEEEALSDPIRARICADIPADSHNFCFGNVSALLGEQAKHVHVVSRQATVKCTQEGLKCAWLVVLGTREDWLAAKAGDAENIRDMTLVIPWDAITSWDQISPDTYRFDTDMGTSFDIVIVPKRAASPTPQSRSITNVIQNIGGGMTRWLSRVLCRKHSE